MLRLRTIKEAYKEIKEADPGTAITMYFIQSLVADKNIPTILYGNRYLVNMDDLENILMLLERGLADPTRPMIKLTGRS